MEMMISKFQVQKMGQGNEQHIKETNASKMTVTFVVKV